MKKFIVKLARLALLLLLSFFPMTVLSMLIGNQFLDGYQASLVDKVNRLQSTQDAKIILIGNSNVCFGFQSDLIESAFNMPVVDMGLNGGLGNAFHENMVKLGVSEGDIVIVCHSSYSDDDHISDSDLAWITLEHHKQLWPIVRAKDLPSLLIAFPNYFLKASITSISGILGQRMNISREDSCYSRSAFNQYGDIVVRFDDTYEFTEGSVTVPKINDICINRLNLLKQYVESKGATLLVAGYPIGYGKFTPPEAEFDDFEQELRSKLECDVISHYTDYFIPYNLFYDSSLHLSEEGARIRTELLISDLSQWMQRD